MRADKWALLTPEQRALHRQKVREYRQRVETTPSHKQQARERTRKYRQTHSEWRERHRLARAKFCADGVQKVYFVQVESGPIKIGFTTKRMAGRLQELQCGNHEKLTLLKAIPATRVVEKEMHDRFLSARIRNEWFRPTEELLAFIESLPTLSVTT